MTSQVSIGYKVSTVLLFFTSVFISFLLISVIVGSHNAEHTLQQYKFAADALRTGTADPAAVQSFLSEAAGGLTGSVPVFLQNSIFSYDMGGLGSSVVHLADSVVNGTAKFDSIHPRCDNNKTDCLSAHVSTYASLVGSIASKISEMGRVNDTTTGEAAFSENELRLDTLLGWVKAQSHPTNWKEAADACMNFTKNVRSVDWGSISYFDPDAVATKSSNITADVLDVVSYVEDVCGALVLMPTPEPTPAPPTPIPTTEAPATETPVPGAPTNGSTPSPGSTPAPPAEVLFTFTFNSSTPYNATKFAESLASLMGVNASDYVIVEAGPNEVTLKFVGSSSASLAQKMENLIQSNATAVASDLGASAVEAATVPPSPSSPASPSSGDEGSSFPIGAIVGIVVGVVVIGAAVAACVVLKGKGGSGSGSTAPNAQDTQKVDVQEMEARNSTTPDDNASA